MKKAILILCSVAVFSLSSTAQPGINGNSNYSEDRQRQAREWQATERHYQNISSSSSPASPDIMKGTGAGSSANNWADYSHINAQNAAGRRIQQRADAFQGKVEKMNRLLKERNITLSKENWSKIEQAGLDAGFDAYMISRMYGTYDPAYKPDYVTDSKGRIVTAYVPLNPKSIRDLGVTQQQTFNNYVAKAKAETEVYNKIALYESALLIFKDPGIQAELANQYIKIRNYRKAREILFDSEHNIITENKPPLKTLLHRGAYISLIESEYTFAERAYRRIYNEAESDKEIICETASANFHLGNYDDVYDIMKNACFNNPANKNFYTLAGSAVMAIDSAFSDAENLFSTITISDKSKNLNSRIAKKIYDEVQTYRKQTGKVTVVTIFLLDLAVMLEPKNIDYRAERYDSNASLGRSRETTIDEPFLK